MQCRCCYREDFLIRTIKPTNFFSKNQRCFAPRPFYYATGERCVGHWLDNVMEGPGVFHTKDVCLPFPARVSCVSCSYHFVRGRFVNTSLLPKLRALFSSAICVILSFSVIVFLKDGFVFCWHRVANFQYCTKMANASRRKGKLCQGKQNTSSYQNYQLTEPHHDQT